MKIKEGKERENIKIGLTKIQIRIVENVFCMQKDGHHYLKKR